MIAKKHPDSRTCDANEATADVAYRMTEVISIYPITPSSPMAEHCDEWAAVNRPNLWSMTPDIVQMQSEGGVAGAMHGSLTAGCLSTTFTASQGLLLMIPNMYKIAGELTPAVIHVSARALATHALSIFGDHSDVMACRQTGWAMLASNSVQEAHDMAAIAHAATLKCRIPFLHFFDGFRTSHEINKHAPLSDEILMDLLDEDALTSFYDRSLTPDNPSIRGTAQNPDVFFQAREAVSPFYKECVETVDVLFKRFEELTGRSYSLFEYEGHPEAEKVIVIMGSGAETAEETSKFLNANGEKTGVLKVRLFRPFNTPAFIKALPDTVKSIAVLDRTKEPGSIGEPIHLDVAMALRKARTCPTAAKDIDPVLVGGRYGLGSKEFTPAMVKSVFDALDSESPQDHFTVGIFDDISNKSLPWDPAFSIESDDVTNAVFFGLGSDGTVGASKNTVKIIGENAGRNAQAYFVYDSKKSGSVTVSHLRFGEAEIHAPYLIEAGDFVSCSHTKILESMPVVEKLKEGGVFLLNAPCESDQIWDMLPGTVQQALIAKKAEFYHIDALAIAKAAGLGGRINTIMQTCFFQLSGVLPAEEAIAHIKAMITKTYSRKGDKIVNMNCAAVDDTLSNLAKVDLPATATSQIPFGVAMPDEAPDFVKQVTGRIIAGEGDLLPVSAFPIDGTWPTGTSQYEKRGMAAEIPEWNTDLCTQCNKCATVCPHAAIRPKFYEDSLLTLAPEPFKSMDFNNPAYPDTKYTIQLSPDDCTGCGVCVEMCPGSDGDLKALIMKPTSDIVDGERESYKFWEKITQPEYKGAEMSPKSLQFKKPLIEYSGACAGCGQTPYLKMLTQLVGDHMMVANATGCSSIYGGNLPTTPYTTDECGRGPAWANSLFEDNAEFGMGMLMSVETRSNIAKSLLQKLEPMLNTALVNDILGCTYKRAKDLKLQRERIEALKEELKTLDDPDARRLNSHADYLAKKTVWVIGGDGWAYDIGFGGLDHVLASGKNINIMVMDTEVYSNTGGQSSKATPIAAVAKFSAAGKEAPKKDLATIAMSYGNVYVAQIALGGNEKQAMQAMKEAESFDGPSLIIAYGACLAHGFDLRNGHQHQRDAVKTGYWPLFRYDPRNEAKDQPRFVLESGEPDGELGKFLRTEGRYRALEKTAPGQAEELFEMAEGHINKRFERYEQLTKIGAETEDDDDGWG
ncbi:MULTISPECIES: pyruvate:ferredoxin (flavodoxin) oxidoreductase [unclassified Lentimonas]|uniref:pyruvate:ferredoxin (flavodoxin) oxidoreductase n=1 Tax=unclassified Lentimonas TaxID=2630993 RepID=UPI00132171E1|nr:MULTISPECIES: pyruvate:ferredoxin (flavodoxin) oxidoreductase [unclassified Lentimonas]CAA6694989.1 Pyruvate-flavodoxin oxidoreductase (EC [Lentimonas sp. CC19]CAA6695349.1 Pyruvate-flavodoxin oxidoreductase (EC [Lentimonas sp. CC10]CAA7072020.1 Pyruvate-flavodoxin oxidoreductase (EC [Lentimonas sp. CC11]